MPAKGHEVTRIITSSRDLWDDVVDGAILSDGGFPAMGTNVVGFLPNDFTPVFIGGHYSVLSTSKDLGILCGTKSPSIIIFVRG